MKKQYGLFILALTLLGCDQTEHIKNQTQLKLNNKFAVCYSLGISNFTFPVDIIDVPKPNSFDYDFEKTAKVFKIFTTTGFLTEEEFVVNVPAQNTTITGYRYNITPEGKKHYNRNSFCFGEIVINQIVKSKDIEYNEYVNGFLVRSRVDMGKIIDYTYTVDNVPQWANLPELVELYDLTIHFDGRLNEGSLRTENRGTDIASRTDTKQLFKGSKELLEP